MKPFSFADIEKYTQPISALMFQFSKRPSGGREPISQIILGSHQNLEEPQFQKKQGPEEDSETSDKDGEEENKAYDDYSNDDDLFPEVPEHIRQIFRNIALNAKANNECILKWLEDHPPNSGHETGFPGPSEGKEMFYQAISVKKRQLSPNGTYLVSSTL